MTLIEWQTMSAVVGALSAILGLAFAGFQLRRSAISAESVSRPYLNVRFHLKAIPDASPKSSSATGMVFVVVESVGATPAVDIALAVEPPFEIGGSGGGVGDGDLAVTALRHIFDGDMRISMLAPGERLRFVLDEARNVMGEPNDVPTRYKVTALYGASGSRRRFSESFVLDFDPWRYSIMEAEPIDVIARQIRRLNETFESKA